MLIIIYFIDISVFISRRFQQSFFFFFNDTATTEIYTLSLHDALPIFVVGRRPAQVVAAGVALLFVPASLLLPRLAGYGDRKSTRLNSSHTVISYAVFCLKKKKKYAQYAHFRSTHCFRQNHPKRCRLFQ